MYALLGTQREVTIGPTAVNAIMSFSYAGGDADRAVTLAFWAGILEMLCGFFSLGER